MAIIYMVDISAAFVAIKETLGLLKVVNDAKTDHEVRSATSEIQSKLLTLQSECFALGDMVRSHEAEVVTLKAKIAEFEDFKAQTEGYVLNQLESGTLVYSKNEVVGDAEVAVHLCPNCHSKRVISMLQPLTPASYAIFNQSRCPSCNNVFDTYRAPPINWSC